MAAGICDVTALVEELQRCNWTDIPAALRENSARQVPEGIAVTELNYVQQVFGHPAFVLQSSVKKLLGLPTFSASIGDPSTKYSAILKQ